MKNENQKLSEIVRDALFNFKTKDEWDNIISQIENLEDEVNEFKEAFKKQCLYGAELEEEIKILKEILDSLTGDEKLAIIHWKRLFDSYVDLRDKNKDTDMILLNIHKVVKDMESNNFNELDEFCFIYTQELKKALGSDK
jgi:predicted nuclease with TOPRIM domain